jgi:Concanavalin A-like lectin/glucanases superfamily
LIIFINRRIMKKFLFVLLSIVIANSISAQGITKNGKATSTASTFVNQNGAVGISGMNKNGALFSPINSGATNALDLDGTNDYVSLPAGVYFNGDFTIECWIYPKSFASWARIIDFGNGAGSDNVLLAYTYGSSGAPGFYVEGSQFQANQTLPLNQWSHIAATLSGTTATIYINGIAAGTGTFPTPVNITRNKCYIGKSNWADPYANAIFDELRIWNTAKTQAEIQASMNTELAGNEPGLVAYYNFNQGVAGGTNTTVTSLSDMTVNAYNGTLTNFALSGTTSNWVDGAPLLYDGSSALAASSSAYAIKQSYPASTDGYYWIKNSNINGGNPFRIYADMTTDGGGWTLIMCNANNAGWTYPNAISLNTTSPSINSNYSIIGWADYIKRSTIGFQYMIDAKTRNSYGGIWTANGAYTFLKGDNTQTNITLNSKFGTWTYNDAGIEQIMPWYSNCSGYITTSNLCNGGSWWGTLISQPGWTPAPWINGGCGVEGCMPNPGIIWYWVR